MTGGFCRYDLRTTDTTAARAFYAATLGIDFDEEGSFLAIWPLHEQAIARGAPAHWLGQLQVADAAATVQRVVAEGGQLLSPSVLRGKDGEAFAVVRDPCEAVVGVRETSRLPTRAPVAWHQLHTRDVERSWAVYAELFGWQQTGTLDVGGAEGEHRVFRWSGADKDVGGIANTARLPGVHPHWLYYFAVADLGGTLATAKARGGNALAPVVLPNGDRIVACEDPQGAAFGLIQSA
ncbi:MAG: VOC family protein [Polyangiaceae bacterium]|nr:VOC family protein [Polyangiaceae bacterium]